MATEAVLYLDPFVIS